MAKILSTHMIGLRPGIKGEAFEKFFRGKVVPGLQIPGWKLYLLKEDRGDREGKYLAMWEIESVEARNRFAPSPDQPSAEAANFLEFIQDIGKEWDTYASPIGAPTIYTDYVVVGETKSAM